MNDRFTERLKLYLDSECEDHDMSYSWEWCEDSERCNVEVKTGHPERVAIVSFVYDKDKDELQIETMEDCFTTTHYFNRTVKYFWILVAPALFPENG